MTLGDDFISRCIVKRATKRINDAGGCDVKDEYSKGYDDAITLVLNIFLEETGYVLEDALDDGEDKEIETI